MNISFEDMADLTFSAQAVCKMLLHSVKYPHCAINGVLLSEDTRNKGDSKNISPSTTVKIIDAVPLFHQSLNVSPMMEIALTQIDHLVSSSGLVLAGYYLANENITDVSFDRIGKLIADKIADNYPPACLVVLDNTSALDIRKTLNVYQRVNKVWTAKESSSFLVDNSVHDVLPTILHSQAYKSLVDFDNHLDNITLDWRNNTLNVIIQDFVKTSSGVFCSSVES